MARAYVEYPLTGRRGEGKHTKVDLGVYEWLAGRRAQLTPQGYAQVRMAFRSHSTPLHREIMGLDPGDGQHTDHINRDRLDNRRENLRFVTQQENNCNMTPPRGPRTRGTTPKRGRWQAQARDGERHISLGVWDTQEEAFIAAETYRILHYPGYISEDRELQEKLLVMGGSRAHEVPQF